MLRPLRRALLSVSDKTGLVEFAQDLVSKYGVELVATGGTQQAIIDAGLPVRDVTKYTQFPEMLDGRVKTLHPGVLAGVLAKRDKADHLATLARHGFPEFDLVVCNLYPFEKTASKPGITEAELVEQIDIGGPTMIRAAAKNFAGVAVMVDPADYWQVLQELYECKGQTRQEARRRWAAAAFARVAKYDKAIDQYFNPDAGDDEDDGSGTLSATFMPMFERMGSLRHGENPHQSAMYYREMPRPTHACIATAQKLHGKELSYNNILDMDAALTLVREFPRAAAVVVKHNNPCGAAEATSPAEAFRGAWDGDPLSAFGGIVAFNRAVDVETAAALMDGEKFVECVIAPDYDPTALTMLTGWKKNVRLLKTGPLVGPPQGLDYRRVDGGLLVQARDHGADNPKSWQVVTAKKPTGDQWEALWFAWVACKHVKSNAIVLAQGTQLVGVGAGQMSRVESVKIAIGKAGDRAKGSAMASDAFFPFPDNVELAAAAGVAAIVQPGGSVKDAESIAACDTHGIAMLFTGVRHFRH
jgi:phosphoribosylaminoimidazolecarboxamide formyltransferase / IMP cyclohydrolase